MNQKGFTLIEVLVALAVGTVILFGVVGSIFLVMRGTPEIRGQVTALADMESASHWLTRDVAMGLSTDLVDNDPPVAQMTLTWSDLTKAADLEGSVSHSVTYTYSGSELQRNYDGVTTIVGRQLTDVGFSLNGNLMTVTLSCSPERASHSTVTRKYVIAMRAYSNPGAPAAPTGLVATAGGERSSLDWNNNSEGDLDGYNVYRSTTSGSGYTKVNTGLVSTSSYTDYNLTSGTTYYYVVTAVDLGTNESGYSNENSATPTILYYYLHNNPTPPTGDTNSQTVLPINSTTPIAITLHNYDQNRDASAGLYIPKGGSGPGETDPIKHQVWRSGALSNSLELNGTITIDIWAAMKDFSQGKEGEVIIYLRDYNGSTYTEIDNGNVSESDWQGGSSTWVMKTITISGLNYTVTAGNELEVELIVGINSGDDMWFAYDTISYSFVVEIP